jgi:5'-nucleotidase/UDP-sugar diphosphatase
MNLRKVVFAFIVLIVTGLLTGSSSCAQPKTLTILHTNDIHAAFLPHEAGWVQATPKPMVGGIGELAWMVDSVRKVKTNNIFLDGGDVMTGTPISEFDYKGGTGGALFQMMNLIGYDAWTIGNHDLDISQDNLKKLTDIATFQTVSANLTDSAGGFPLHNKPYVILNKAGLRIGIIGLMSKDLYHLTNTNNLNGLIVHSPEEVTQKIVDAITPQTDLIIALTHEGVDEDSILAAATHGINVIIGGHSHTRLKSPKFINNVIICQTGSSCENLGELEIIVENHTVTHYDGKLLQLWARHTLPENDLTKLVGEFKGKIDKEYGEVIGTLTSDWKRGGKGESNIGNFIADAMREGANAQIGVTNSSGIRKDKSAGSITKLDLFEIVPFRNVLCTFRMNGKDLRAFAERYAQSLSEGKSSIQISGLKCTWKNTGGKVTIEKLTVMGETVADDKTYLCATSDFVVNQADKYLGMIPTAVEYTPTTVFQTMVAKVQHDKTVNSVVENRFQEIQ